MISKEAVIINNYRDQSSLNKVTKAMRQINQSQKREKL